MRRPWRPTVRLRLTLLYAGAFFLAGVVLIAFIYLLFKQALDHQLADRVASTERLTEDYFGESGGHDGARVGQLHQALEAQFQQDRDDTLRTMLMWSTVSLGVVGVVAGGLGWLLAGRALRPLHQITATARRVADRSLHERIALDGPDDEIRDLADTFDAMLERLDRSFDGQRRFVAHASHELRTPLAINRTLIDVALDDPQTPASTRRLGAKLLQVSARHERLIDGLLVLASSDQPLTELSAVDLADIARGVATSSEATAGEARVEIRATLGAASMLGDPVLLERLAQNLLDNAIRYNLPEHGWASITTGVADGQPFLTVENTGPTVPDREVDGLFEPFRRLTPADRPTDSGSAPPGRGAGLGLSIVRSVAHAHDGEAHAHARHGGGLVVRVQLPLTPTRPAREVAGQRGTP